MKKTRNIGAKIVAGIALAAIVIGIVGTGILFIVESYQSYNNSEISQEQLQELIDNLPEPEAVSETQSGELIEVSQ